MIETVAVYCASADGCHPAYRAAAAELGTALAANGIGLVYGGARVGLMQAVADAALLGGGTVVGVIPEVLAGMEVAHSEITELHVVDSMHTRKAMMAKLSDAFIVLPGGFGTLEEVFEMLTWQTLKLHAKPIILLNTNGYYDKLLAFLDHAVAEGMLKRKNRAILFVAATTSEVLQVLISVSSRDEAKVDA